ncbi:nitroreductase family protein [Salinibacterium sp. ZJ454]|uniref:nitroreductase family protein n=1 Tax=Salinibacterium sp. ZJ454 TaxID=2708339 RepID=UPI00141F6D2D|nr:nitroreductase family protein [Salinibacterium sp. ZJ454]
MAAGTNSGSPNTDVFHIIATTRAMRRLKAEPVPRELITQIIQAGICAPNGGNAQNWRFLVVEDPIVKATVQAYYRRAFDEVVRPLHLSTPPPPGTSNDEYSRQLSSVEYLTDHIHEAPVWIVPCQDTSSDTRSAGASIYPAVQNMLLAARALGLGATLTTRHLLFQNETEAALGLPSGTHSYAILPIGWPRGRFGPVRRGVTSQVAYLNRWGAPYPSDARPSSETG